MATLHALHRPFGRGGRHRLMAAVLLVLALFQVSALPPAAAAPAAQAGQGQESPEDGRGSAAVPGIGAPPAVAAASAEAADVQAQAAQLARDMPRRYTAQGIAARDRAARGQARDTKKPPAQDRDRPEGPTRSTPTRVPPGATARPGEAPAAKLTPTPAAHWAAGPEAAAAAAAQAPEALAPPGQIGPVIEFDGVTGVTTPTPPDSTIAAGPNNVVVAVNALVLVYTKSGTLESVQQLGGPAGSGALVTTNDLTLPAFDPWVVFDPYINRFWLMWESENDSSTGSPGNRSSFYVALSNSSDANQGWSVFTFDATIAGSTPTSRWCDHAKLGFDAQAIYITCNMFTFPAFPATGSSSFSNSKIRMMGKSQFLNNTCCGWFDLNDFNAFTLQPARMYGATAADGMYLVAAGGLGGDGDTLDVWKVTNPLASSPTRVKRSVGVADFDAPAPAGARQSGSTLGIDVGDARLQFAIWKGGRLTTGHNVTCSGNACAGFEEIDVSAFPTMTVKNDWSLGFANTDIYFPAADITAGGYRVMVYNQSGPTTAAGVRFVGIPPSSECTGCFDFQRALEGGQGAHVNCGQANPSCATPAPGATPLPTTNRWGDYSGAASDPDGAGIWLHGEYALANIRQYSTRVGMTLGSRPPGNDDFGDAVRFSGGLPIQCPLTQSINAGATIQRLELGPDVLVSFPAGVCAPTSRTMSKTVWYEYKANFTGTMNVDDFNTIFDDVDTVLAVYHFPASGISPLKLLACSDDAPSHGLQSRVSFPVKNGDFYYIQLGSFSQGAGGQVDLNLGPGLTVSPTTVPLGGQITVTWTGIGFPTTSDAFGVVQAGKVGCCIGFLINYLNCQIIGAPSSPIPGGSCQMTLSPAAGASVGTFEVQLLRDTDTFGFSNTMSVSNTFTVTTRPAWRRRRWPPARRAWRPAGRSPPPGAACSTRRRPTGSGCTPRGRTTRTASSGTTSAARTRPGRRPRPARARSPCPLPSPRASTSCACTPTTPSTPSWPPATAWWSRPRPHRSA